MENAVQVGVSAKHAVVRLAWPLASLMLGETLMGLVDTKLVGGLGAAALGGVGLANAALYLTNIATLGLMRSVKVCTAHAVGRGLPHLGVAYVRIGACLGLGVGLIFAGLLAHAHWVWPLFDLHGELADQAGAYLRARAYGLPAFCALAALMEHRQGLGQVRSSLWIGLGGNLLNGVLAYSLIYGHLGLPALGVEGAGLGTAITEWVQLALMAAMLLRDLRRGVWRGNGEGLPFMQGLRELSAVGLPTAVHFGFEYLAFAACTGILAQLGEAEVAAHQIAVVINRLAYLPGLAMGEVACILVSNALGANDLQEAERSVRAALTTAVSFMVVVGILLATCGSWLVGMFSEDPLIIQRTARVLLLAGVFQILDAVNIVMRGALRGARDVRVAAMVGVVVLWSTVPTVTYLLGRIAGWGVLGGWCSFVLQTAICASVYTYRWRYGRWRTQPSSSWVAAVQPGGGPELASRDVPNCAARAPA